MLVIVNNKQIEVFSGAKVADAVLRYFTIVYGKKQKGPFCITDRFGNRLMPDGELTENQQLIIKKTRTISRHNEG